MSAAWMFASTVVAILFALAATALVRVAALYRGASLRWIWIAATAASIAIALTWLRPKPTSSVAAADAVASTETRRVSPTAPSAPTSDAVTASTASTRHLPDVALPRLPFVLDSTLRTLWFATSAGLFTLLSLTTIRLYAERKQWRWEILGSTRVLVSKTFGPALIGLGRPEIVVPEWVLALDESSQRAIIAHEEEHRAANDPVLLLAGLAVLVLMPWNIGLWMSWRGLRRTIELDCDARVIARGIDGSEYAAVLLGAWKSAHGHWLPSAAFAERASGLGSRVEHLMRPEPRRRPMRTIIGTAVATGLVFIACSTPSPQRQASSASAPYPLVIVDGVRRPDLPPRFRFTGRVVVESTTTPTFRVMYHGAMVEDTAARTLYPSPDSGLEIQTIDAPASVVHFGDDARYGAVLYYTKKYRDAGGAIIAPTEGNRSARAADPATASVEMALRIYDRMFNGISLPSDQKARALAIIESESKAQGALHGPVLVTWPRRIELNAARDTELRALLSTDTDRARFDARSVEGRPRTVTLEDVAQNQYVNLFRNPSTPAAVKARAVAIITTALYDEAALYRRLPDDFDGRLAIRARRDTALRALLPEEERAMFDNIAPRTRDGEIKRPD
ncbi:MAG: M56 family metallopeptidase [bacterium]